MGVAPEEQNLPVSNVLLMDDLSRAKDAMGRAKSALDRAMMALYRIKVHKSAIVAEPSTGDPMVDQAKAAALALINHQAGLCEKAYERTKVWERKCRKRAERVIAANGHDYASLVKAVRYAFVAEKGAHRCETQGYWADYYRVDETRAGLIDGETRGDEE